MSGRVLFLLHSRIPPASADLLAARSALEATGHTVEVLHRRSPPGEARPELAVEHVAGAELVVTFGGDGTFLRAARVAIAADVPLLGVNLGRLGFLTWVDMADAPAALTAWGSGATTEERRRVMRVMIGDRADIAINEAALLKEPRSNVIQVEVRIDGDLGGTFHADGALVASPTGSTAYSLSAGGPLLDPRADALVFVPVNAHTLAGRALVVPGGSPVGITVDEPTRVLLDGSEGLPLGAGEALRCTLDGPEMRLVRVPGSAGFYEQLRARLEWGRPLVREQTVHRERPAGAE